jgi:hypothetical protein
MSFVHQVHDDGYSVIPCVLEASQVDALIAAVEAMGPKDHGARNLLQRSPAIAGVARSAELMRLVTAVIGEGAFPVRALFFDKVEGANWQVGWHQDLSIAVAERLDVPGFSGWSAKQGVLHVQPPAEILERMLTLRAHLDDCDEDNGPLRILPESHRDGRLTDEQIEHWKVRGREVTCLVARGGVVMMRPLLLHASSPANKPRHRRVIHLEYAVTPLPGGLQWFERHSGNGQV